MEFQAGGTHSITEFVHVREDMLLPENEFEFDVFSPAMINVVTDAFVLLAVNWIYAV